jgi:hypothetical protein
MTRQHQSPEPEPRKRRPTLPATQNRRTYGSAQRLGGGSVVVMVSLRADSAAAVLDLVAHHRAGEDDRGEREQQVAAPGEAKEAAEDAHIGGGGDSGEAAAQSVGGGGGGGGGGGRYAVPSDGNFDIDTMAALATHVRKDVAEDLRRRLRTQSRRQFQAVRDDAELFSLTQLAQFRKSSALNARLVEVQKRVDGVGGEGTRVDSESGLKFVLRDRRSDEESAGAGAGSELLGAVSSSSSSSSSSSTGRGQGQGAGAGAGPGPASAAVAVAVAASRMAAGGQGRAAQAGLCQGAQLCSCVQGCWQGEGVLCGGGRGGAQLQRC